MFVFSIRSVLSKARFFFTIVFWGLSESTTLEFTTGIRLDFSKITKPQIIKIKNIVIATLTFGVNLDSFVFDVNEFLSEKILCTS